MIRGESENQEEHQRGVPDLQIVSCLFCSFGLIAFVLIGNLCSLGRQLRLYRDRRPFSILSGKM